jgi:hypothetical protein
MTTPVRQYQNISYKELMSFTENNPNRDRNLTPIEIQTIIPLQETPLDILGLKGYTAFNLNPSGPISLCVCINNPNYYMIANKGAKLQSIIDMTTYLQEKTEELKNSHLSRKRKKIHDLIGSAYNGTRLEDKEYTDIFSGISFIQNTQFVLMKSAVQENIEEGEKQYSDSYKGEIVFSSNPINWKKDVPTWIADFRARWVAIPTEQYAMPINKVIGEWLSTIEQKGWIIQWPESELTKTEIIEYLSVLPTWQQSDKSLKKEVLASRLGKSMCIKLFTKWLITNNTLEEEE